MAWSARLAVLTTVGPHQTCLCNSNIIDTTIMHLLPVTKGVACLLVATCMQHLWRLCSLMRMMREFLYSCCLVKLTVVWSFCRHKTFFPHWLLIMFRMSCSQPFSLEVGDRKVNFSAGLSWQWGCWNYMPSWLRINSMLWTLSYYIGLAPAFFQMWNGCLYPSSSSARL